MWGGGGEGGLFVWFLFWFRFWLFLLLLIFSLFVFGTLLPCIPQGNLSYAGFVVVWVFVFGRFFVVFALLFVFGWVFLFVVVVICLLGGGGGRGVGVYFI